jgi:hypothetical protein
MNTHRQNLCHIFLVSLCSSMFAMTLLPAQGADLESKTEHSVGISLFKYTYMEPNVMTLKAQNIGFEYAGTYAFGSQWPSQGKSWFIGGDIRYATGAADYESPISGTVSDTPNRYVEGRLILGKDFDMGTYVLAPYAGLGLRLLHNDLRRHPGGYRRDNSYSTVPLGVVHRIKLSDQSVLSTTVEYSHLLSGTQKAQLTDTKLHPENVSLDQNKGHGFRLAMMLRIANMSFGPTVSYWNIAKSDVYKGWYEPANTTREIGLKAQYHF